MLIQPPCRRRPLTRRSWLLRPQRVGASLLLAALLVSCSGDGGTPPVTPVASIAVTLSSPTLTVIQGNNNTVTVNIARTNFTGSVDLTAEGLPSGVTATFAPTSVPAGSAASTLTFTSVASTAVGASTITIRARGTGVSDQTASLALTISPPPSIAVATPATGISLIPGVTDATLVTLTRLAFTGAVALSVTGLPSGVTATVADPSLTGTTTSIALAASSTAQAGTSTVTVTATGTGVAAATTTFSLLIAATTGTAVPLRYCGLPAGVFGTGIPLWVAAQSGTGAWRQLTRESPNVFTASLTGPSGVAAVYQIAADRFSVRVLYGTPSELQALGSRPCVDAGTKVVTGSVAGLGAGDVFNITAGPSPATVTTPNTAFMIGALPESAFDLVAIRRASATLTANRVITRRAINPATGAVLPVLDFAGTEAFDVDVRQITVANPIGGETHTVFSNGKTNGTAEFLLSIRPATSAATFAYDAIPLTRLIAGDVQWTTVVAGAQSGTNGTSRVIRNDFRDPMDRTVTLGPVLLAPTVSTITQSPSVRMRAQGTRQPEYASAFQAVFNQVSVNTIRDASINATAAYLGAGTSYDLAMPDLSSVAGWRSVYGFQGLTTVAWSIGAADWTGAPRTGFRPLPADGIVVLSADRTGATIP